MALKAVFFDVGETLVDEERWWRVFAMRAGLQPHVVWAALGVTIERGEEHDELWRHLGSDRPTNWWSDLVYELEDLYPDAIPCLEALRSTGLRVGIVGNQTEALERWVREAALPADVMSSPRASVCASRTLVSSSASWSSQTVLPGSSRMSETVSTTTSCPRSPLAWSLCTSGVGRGGGFRQRPPECLRSTRWTSFRTR